jgi:D-alanyl-D-alanine carboxypeptidase (penicillin-binding protein 5/6)
LRITAGRAIVHRTFNPELRISSRARLALPLAPLIAIAPRFARRAAAQDAPWVAPAPPEVTAASIYSLDITRGTELFVKNPDERRAMGSLAKIATALTVRKYAEDLDQVITIEESDLVPDPTQYSNMALKADMRLPVRDLLTGLLIPSANDAAAAFARVLGAGLPGGEANPQQAFMDAVNQLAYELGATSSHFATPDGLEPTGDLASVEHVTTARDLAKLASHLLADEFLAGIVQTYKVEITPQNDGAEPLLLFNTNKDLPDAEDGYAKDNVVGVKTGSTELAGGCLVIAATEGDNRVVTVVMGSLLDYTPDEDGNYKADSRWDDFDAIYAKTSDDYAWQPIDDSVFPGLKAELDAWGVSLKAPGTLVLPKTGGNPRYRLELGPAAQPEAEAGRVLFFAGSTVVAALPVYQNATA